ncbi:MAG: hypothetical protein SP1CHLAM54_15700 [Chlamydiia bacterium]|nr:hypothetical protein [Chlamydiia bacterium]MCH9616459.1 hypothetical protein [Chlamydiia bacterium]MCH9629555.1 hypothetical protein [Chlamydiia bacterium]
MLLVEMRSCGEYGTNAILLADTDSKKAVCIDPGDGALGFFLEKEEWDFEAIWLTHSHFDHIADLATLKAKYQLPVWVHPLDEKNVLKPGSDGLKFDILVAPCKVDHHFEDGMRMKLGAYEFEVLHLPGHSPGGVAFYCESEKLLISGDVLFKAGFGRVDLPHSDPMKMRSSINRLCALPEDTLVYPGHGETTTIGDEAWRYK